MTVQQQRKRQARKQLIERRVIIASVAILFLGIAVVLWILSGTAVIQGAWSNFFSILFVFASVLIGLFQWLFPVNSPAAEPLAPVAPAVTPLSSAPLTPVLPPQAVPWTPAPEKVPYRGIMGLPPPTDARTIQQRENAVRHI